MIKRFDRLEVVTADLADAGATYQGNFGFGVRMLDSGDEAAISIGDAEIRLRSGWEVAKTIKASGEGMSAIRLEADDLGQVMAALTRAGIGHRLVEGEADKRILEVDSQATNRVPLFIFEHKPPKATAQ
jgi:hypothetical protein